MRIGKMNKLVALERPVLTQDDSTGAMTRTWAHVARVWADVRYLNGLETLRSASPVSVARASIRIRRRAGVEATWRVVMGSTTFNIQAVLPDEEGNEFIDLTCETGANNG